MIGRCETETTGRLRAVGRETPSIRDTRTPPRWFSSLDDTRHTAIDFAVAAAIMLSLIGIMVAVWSEKFDNQAAIQNFVITPLVFLSGTFYSVDRLSGIFAAVSRVNPFFYLIDGFRYGFIGESDSSVILGAVVVAAIDAVLWLVCYLMFARGYKLKT